ncbi:hypothetical protein ACFL59_05985, partial [Planctomycetota bacterium]
ASQEPQLKAIFPALARYGTDGSLDTGFGDNGTVYDEWGGAQGRDMHVVMYDVARQADGKLVIAGRTEQVHVSAGEDSGGEGSDSESFVVTRYGPDGTRDQGFGASAGGDPTPGLVTSVGAPDGAFALAIQDDGRIVVAGFGVDETSTAPDPVVQFVLTRYFP